MASSASERQRVRALIQRAGVAMLMTIDEDAAPSGRPMLPPFFDNDPCIYFLTSALEEFEPDHGAVARRPDSEQALLPPRGKHSHGGARA
jgi:Pyridoxamine 5'-phosphate oxidase